MNIRLQTWFPYHIQVCLNGREWLRRCLEQQRIEFLAKGNKLLYISDYQSAQKLLEKQLDVRFSTLLDAFVPIVFPLMHHVLGPHLSYYWTMWQSEWASDLIFESPGALNSIAASLLRHAHMTATSTRVLRYLYRPLTLAGKPHSRSIDEVLTRVSAYNDGVRGLQLAIAAIERQDLTVADEQLQKVELQAPDLAEAQYYRALLNWWLSRPIDEPVSRALAGNLDPSQRGFMEGLRLVYQQDHLTPAIEKFRELVARFPDHRDIQYGLFEALYHGGYPAEAMVVYRRLGERYPRFRLGIKHALSTTSVTATTTASRG